MKIFYLIDTSPQNGGAPISTCTVAKEISAMGNVTNIILPAQDKEFTLPQGVKPLILERFSNSFPSPIYNPIKFLRLALDLRNSLKAERPDIFHAQMPRGALAAGLMKFMGLLPSDIKLVYTDREQMGLYPWPLRILCNLFIKAKYDEVICLTKSGSKFWQKSRWPIKISIIPNSAGRIYENYNVKKREAMRDKFRIPKDMLVVMFAGRMVKEKNWSLALEIIEKISTKKITPFFIIGTANIDQKAEAQRFINEVRQITDGKFNGLIDVDQTEMPDYYYVADIFVLTSDKEAFGRTAIEAMSRRCVIIGRDVGGIPEVINKKENILNRDAKVFYSRIMQYKTDRELLEADKEWFFLRFYDNYTTAMIAIKHRQLYERIITNEKICSNVDESVY